MPPRMAAGGAAGWEVAVSAAATVLAIVVAARLAGYVYERAVLHTGARLTLRQAWRATPA